MTYLPDVNVWIASIVAEHPQNGRALAWFREVERDSVAFCRVTQMGVLRLLTNARVMLDAELSVAEAWKVLDKIRQDQRIVFTPEPRGMEQPWREAMASHTGGANCWTDAFLAVFAQLSGHSLVTFDRGFAKYRNMNARVL